MDLRLHDLETMLREHGYSKTRQRRLVFDILTDQEPMTMYELYGCAKGQLDRASTYRIVTLFEKLGIVQRVNIGWKYKIELSDKFADHHHHLVCLGCGKVIQINQNELETLVTHLGNGHGFRVVDHQVELQGYCEQCRVTP